METRLSRDRALELRREFGFPNGEAVSPAGQSGGLALFWRRDVPVMTQSMSKSHIDVVLSCDTLSPKQWRLTGFYGEPRRELRKNSWYLMRFLRAQLDLPWLCHGDFNEVLSAQEHFGANPREHWQIAQFQDVCAECGLNDLGFNGPPFTWDNRQEAERNVKVRLDRALGDVKFLEHMGETNVEHVPTVFSDHIALLVKVRESDSQGNIQRRPKMSRYENMWQRHGSYAEFVKQSWGCVATGGGLHGVGAKLSSMQAAFQGWERDIFGPVKFKLKQLREELAQERNRSLYRGPSERERRLMQELAELLAREEEMQRQRSRMDWLKSGDRNTEFFQAKARARGRTNRIRALKTADGSLATDQGVLEQMASNFYRDLFLAQEELYPELICQHVPRKVTAEMGEMLVRPFIEEEVTAALFQMKASKAPGEDGFTAGFFQKHWELLKDEITQAVLGFLNGGEMPESINKTILVLIPKVPNPQELTQFRPISLCNVLYKICSKTMANRLRCVLDDIVSLEQSAFVPGRLITDNVLVAYECIHYLRNKKGKTGACAIKLDMAKAYDRVEWRYLHDIMLALGFPEAWCNLVMKCVTLVTFSVKVNGALSPPFKPTRGIRQGDPISPYLFLLCAEGLTCMLKAKGPQFLSRGIRVSCQAPWFSHLLFADDCLIFTQANRRGRTG
jgi:hypothetical protein